MKEYSIPAPMCSVLSPITEEDRYCAQNYHTAPIVLVRGEGAFVYDQDQNRYYDFCAAHAALNQGHCHPKIVAALQQQAEQLTLSYRALYNDILGPYAAYITDYFGYEKILPMNTGTEAVESAIKIARKWGYEKKNVPVSRAKIIVCSDNFQGHTTTLGALAYHRDRQKCCSPYTPGFEVIPFNDVSALEMALQDPHVVAFLVEPIAGKVDVMLPANDYLQQAQQLCADHDVLLVVNEIQTGLGRMGALLGSCGNCSCSGHCERGKQYVQADMLILGKSLSGGLYPVSAVLADAAVMDVILPGTHGSTYGGNPLACQVAMAALQVLDEEALPQQARMLGKYFGARIRDIAKRSALISEVRGRGLLYAIEIDAESPRGTAQDFCVALRENGILVQPPPENIIRMTPPLVISKQDVAESCDIIAYTVAQYSL